MADDDVETDELGTLWSWFADSFSAEYSPLYHRIAKGVANDPEVLTLVGEAPPTAHLPLVLLGAVHYLLLGGLQHPLGEVYAGRSSEDPAPLFHDLCMAERAELLDLMAKRRVQTNEVGRSVLIGPALTWAARRYRQPVHLVDVGASAGLNLCCDRFLLDYGAKGRCGPDDAVVHIECEVRGGEPPIADALGPIASRVGIDLDPPDLADPDDVRWLLACTWPDTGRLERTKRAIAVAQGDPPTILRGDALETLPGVLHGLDPDGVVCVVTTWAFAYLTVEQRHQFVALLAEWGGTRPVVWLAGDFLGVVDLVEQLIDASQATADGDVLSAVTFDAEGTHPQVLARVHPHGRWLDWRA